MDAQGEVRENVKKAVRALCLFLLPPIISLALGFLAVFALPPQYADTFLGALQDKVALLVAPSERPRLIVIGGSSVAFGQRSDLLAEAFPEYDVINFGLYAGLGTEVMLDLSLPDIRSGDIVLISPEQNQQTLSGFFGAKAMWQAADGQFALLTRLDAVQKRSMLAKAPYFAANKAKLWLSGKPLKAKGIYSRAQFDRWGDVIGTQRACSTMPGGFDPDMPICFDETMLDEGFIAAMNAYALACQRKGASVFYRFCPMNAAAITQAELAKVSAYTNALQARLAFPILGTAEESILDSGWFFDTNFHLNTSGAIVNTARIARQLMQKLNLEGTVSIALPACPALPFEQTGEATRSGSTEWFTWTETNGAASITGLTEAGRQQVSLTLPGEIEGLTVIAFSAQAFAGDCVVREIILPDTLRRIENGSFAGCELLEKIILRQTIPDQLTVGAGLLEGTHCLVIVPAKAYSQYQTSYFWSVHAPWLRADSSEAVEAEMPSAQAMPLGENGTMYVDANGGEAVDGGAVRLPFAISATHLRTNTPMGHKLFRKEGCMPLCWNTQPDGSGEDFAFGSRVKSMDGQVLYMRWVPLTPPKQFEWEERQGEAIITGWSGKGTLLVIPAELGGLPVTVIRANAFMGADITMAALPDTLQTLEENAFANSTLMELWLYDSLLSLDDSCFEGCAQLQTLHIGAATPPRYSISYFAAFADKLDRMRQVQDQPKLVMAGGSASRYAYDSKQIKKAFPCYEPVNMGVYAYTNMLPQYRLMQRFMNEDDILLSAPEFDTTQTQFCITRALDPCFFAMAEADYGCVELLNLQQYTAVFSSLCEYLQSRNEMTARDWNETPRRYDDEGNAIPYDTYNQYGDYTLSRAGGVADELLMYFRADYTVAAFPESLVKSLNGIYREFEQQGVRVLFAYAPRNHSSLTEESNKDTCRALDTYLREKLCTPIIIDIEESLYPGQLFYLIDSHLCDEGVYLHTKKIVQALMDLGIE